MGARITNEQFLERAAQRFGDQFDYSEIVWRSYKSPVKIRCRAHPVQVITITPEKHLQTLGVPSLPARTPHRGTGAGTQSQIGA